MKYTNCNAVLRKRVVRILVCSADDMPLDADSDVQIVSATNSMYVCKGNIVMHV